MAGMPPWTEKRIDWYQRAVAWNGFDKVLVDNISRFVPQDESICDMGCGTGYLAMELARRGYETSAFDMNEVTMAYLREEVPRRGLSEKLTLRQGSWDELGDEPLWDNVVMVFAGHMEDELQRFLGFCRKRLIVIIRESSKSHVQADGVTPRRHTKPGQMEEVLDGMKYDMVPIVTEFGQPLRSMEECIDYLETFGADTKSADSKIHNAVKTSDSEFPLFLPNEKQMRMYVIEK